VGCGKGKVLGLGDLRQLEVGAGFEGVEVVVGKN
jgi:hypothetical protein